MSMKIVALALASVANVAAVDMAAAKTQFLDFMGTFGKTYQGAEMSKRFDIFAENLDMIETHNRNTTHTYTLAMNQFGDLTTEEFKARFNGFKRDPNRISTPFIPGDELKDAPSSLDWVTKGAVTPVKNQGQCGSCWSFSSTGAMEGAHFIATGKLVSLSEQELMDCSTEEGNKSCEGGLMDQAFEWVIKNGGIGTEDSYPYKAADSSTCKKVPNVATITSYKDVTAKSELDLAAAVVLGPVSVAIEADQSGFQFYSKGVFDGTCGDQLDHGVLLVGYGTDSGKDYWKVKNSWGASWGEEGYIRLVRGKDQCGLADAASIPIATAPKPTSPTAPTPAPTPAPTHNCDVDPDAREVCSGGFTTDQDTCTSYGCCWSQKPITSIWCYNKPTATGY